MIEHGERHDETMGALALLPLHQPDHARAARVRTRCHAAMERRRRPPELPAWSAWPAWRRRFEPAIVGALCAVYLFEVLSRAIWLYRF
jgi:hypothetical protein